MSKAAVLGVRRFGTKWYLRIVLSDAHRDVLPLSTCPYCGSEQLAIKVHTRTPMLIFVFLRKSILPAVAGDASKKIAPVRKRAMEDDLDEYVRQEQVFTPELLLLTLIQAAWLEYQRKTGTSGAARVVRVKPTITQGTSTNSTSTTTSTTGTETPKAPEKQNSVPGPVPLVVDIVEKDVEEVSEERMCDFGADEILILCSAFKLPTMTMPPVLHRNDPRALALGLGRKAQAPNLRPSENRPRTLADEIHEENTRKIQSMSKEDIEDAQVCRYSLGPSLTCTGATFLHNEPCLDRKTEK